MRKLLVLMTLLSISMFSFAGEHTMGKVTGLNIEMTSVGHGIAGKIGDKLVFGHLDETVSPKTSQLKVLVDDQVYQTNFTMKDGVWGGTLQTHKNKLDVKLVSLDRTTPAYIIDVNGKEYKVRVEADRFENNHFINPNYILEIDGKEVHAKFSNGQACYMYSLHLIFMIYGSYLL